MAKRLEASGASLICVHGRTREQQYAPYADWTQIARVKEAVNVPVSGNADYNPFESFKKAALQPMEEGEAALMVLHPGFVDEYVLTTSYLTTARALEVAFVINPEVPKWCEENGVQLLTYADM